MTQGHGNSIAPETPHDTPPEDALEAVRSHPGAMLLDLDETLYLRNSTEDFIDTAFPRLPALILLRVLDAIKPWRWTGGGVTRDVWRVRLILICLPWVLVRWRYRAVHLAGEFANQPLLAALRDSAATVIVTTVGFGPIVEPLVRGFGLLDVRIVSARVSTFADRRAGKYRIAVDALGEETVRSALVVTDSIDDLALLQRCGHPVRTVWPLAHRRMALGDVYLPGQYLTHVKRPGGGYIFGGIVIEDFALWILTSLALAAVPVAHVAGLAFLAVSFWAIYERGYVDNDLVAARYELKPQLTAAFAKSPVATPRWGPWLWAIVCGGIGLVLVRWPQQPTITDAAAWLAMLLAIHTGFWLYNRLDKATRVWLFAGLQFARSTAFIAAVPVVPIAAAALGAHVLAKWVPYHLYRLAGKDWPAVPVQLIRLMFFVVLGLLLAFALGLPAIWNWTTLAIALWFVVRARRDIVSTARAANWIGRDGERPRREA